MGGDRGDAGLVVALLGPVEVRPAGGTIAPVAQPRLRVLLGLLGVAAGRMVGVEALVDGLWGEEWSPGREKNLHALVYQLRRRLAGLEPGGAARLARAGAGYRLAGLQAQVLADDPALAAPAVPAGAVPAAAGRAALGVVPRQLPAGAYFRAGHLLLDSLTTLCRSACRQRMPAEPPASHMRSPVPGSRPPERCYP